MNLSTQPIAFTIAGLSMRPFRGEPDYQHVVAINNAPWAADDDQSIDASNQPAGGVHATIFPKENERFNMKRGWTDPVWVRRPWRKRGLAKALPACAMRRLIELGMDEAALSVDTHNPNGALGLYEGIGFKPVKRWVIYRKATWQMPDLPGRRPGRSGICQVVGR